MKKELLTLTLLLTSLFSQSFGQISFQKIYSGMESEWAGQAIECFDGGYAILGTTRSFGAGYDDICLSRTDINGDLLWAKTYGETLGDLSSSFEQTPDGGFILVGYTNNFGGMGPGDLYVLRVNENGDEIWSKVFHGDQGEQPMSVKLAPEGGFMIAGHTRSFGQGNKDYFLLELDEAGNINWSKTYGKADIDDLYSLEKTADGGYIMCGGSGDFDPTGSNVNLIKTDAAGDTLWTKAYRNESPASIGFSAKQTADGGYIIGAYAGEGFTSDYYVIRTNEVGDTLWTKTYTPTTCDDWCRSIRETEDGGFIMSGYSGCEPGVITIKIDVNGNVLWDRKYDGLYNNTRVEITNDEGFLMLTWDQMDVTGYDMRMIKTDESGISGCSESPLGLTASSTNSLVQAGTVIIANCPWTVVDPETIVGIADFVDSTICYSCDSVHADFDFTVIDGEVIFDNQSVSATTWSWNFGDGNSSDEFNPTNTYATSGTYTVCLIADNPLCGEDSICKEITIEIDQSGLVEEANEKIFIYPNPTQGIVNITTGNGAAIRQVRVLTLSGKCILNDALESEQPSFAMDLEELSKGIYLVEVHTTDGILIEKIVRN